MPSAFVPGYSPAAPRLLERFLPPLDDGVAAHFIRAYSQPGDLILDPFGQAPAVAVEALSLERRVVVASANPILRLALSLAIRPPSLSELRAALTQLGDTATGPGAADRLELEVQAMYATTCAACETPATADAFEWDAEAGEPVEKRYICHRCGGPQQAPTDEADRALARRYSRGGLNYHFLLERIAAADDPDRAHAEEVLAVYPARTLAAIGAMLVKLEAIPADREIRRLLAGLLVQALDVSTVLAQDRPKVLSAPRRFRERNFWRAFEDGLGVLAGVARPDQSSTLEELLARPDRPAIYAHAGSVRELTGRLPAESVALALSAVPRPNQALWSLSAVWSAWLWGRQTAEALRSGLRRRRYDWAWHARALQRTLAAVKAPLSAAGRVVTLASEAEPGFTSSLLAAGAGAGLQLAGWTLRADTAEAQLAWEKPNQPAGPLSEMAVKRLARDAAEEALVGRAEPTRWSTLHCAAWAALARQQCLPWLAADPLAPINRLLDGVWHDRGTFQRFEATPADDPATGLWYLAEPPAGPGAQLPLSDAVELEVIRRLPEASAVDEVALMQAVYSVFPGARTPGRGLLRACLASYANQQADGSWQPRQEDAAAARVEEREAILENLRALAARCDYETTGDNPLEWWDAKQRGRLVYRFAVLTTAIVSANLLGPALLEGRGFLVLPGGRAGLVEFKLRRDPRLRRALNEQGWSIVKYRHIRRMLTDVFDLTRATLEPALAGDPLEGMQQLVLLK